MNIVFHGGEPPMSKDQVDSIRAQIASGSAVPGSDLTKLMEHVAWLDRELYDYQAAASEEARLRKKFKKVLRYFGKFLT